MAKSETTMLQITNEQKTTIRNAQWNALIQLIRAREDFYNSEQEMFNHKIDGISPSLAAHMFVCVCELESSARLCIDHIKVV